MKAAAGWFADHGALARATRADVQAELESHVELTVEALVADGASPVHARSEARRRFGDMYKITGRCLAEKHRGELVMKGIIALLATALVLVSGMLVLTTLEMRRAQADDGPVEMVSARHIDLDLQGLGDQFWTPILLGAHDTPRPGDRLIIANNGVAPDIELSVQVDVDGAALLPELGHLEVSRLTRDEIEETLTEYYTPFYADEIKFTVSIERGRR